MMPDDLGAERFADERRALRQIAGLRRGPTRGDHNRYVWPALVCLPCQVEAVSAPRHVHVGEEKLNQFLMLIQYSQSLDDVHRLQHLEPRILKDTGRLHQDQGVVIDDEGVGRIAL